MFEILISMVDQVPKEISLGRMVESLVLLSIIWSKLKPHLTKIEDRIAGLETALRDGFKSGDHRFSMIEDRVTALEIRGNENA